MFSRKLSLSLMLVVLLIGAPVATALADPPPWAPAHGYRAKHRHHYVYYPAYEVYYEPTRSLWFWFGDGGWHFGAHLPAYYPHSHFHSGVTLFLDTPRPYERHVYVVERHGGKHGKRRRH